VRSLGEMGVAAIIPVKRFGAAKRRLVSALGPDARERLAGAMLADVLAAVGRSRRVEHLIVVSGEPAAEQAARAHGAELVGDPEDAGHSRAAVLGIGRALELGADAAALLPGDCPLLDPVELDTALERLRAGAVAVVPDRHGTGTNALLLAPPDAIEPAFGPGSRERHERLARAAGRKVTVERLDSLALDVDTADDLAALRRTLEHGHDRASGTAALLQDPMRV
jgi:2-phospho-L-lactate/phosphoenolpyruvate guanylyltransferase